MYLWKFRDDTTYKKNDMLMLGSGEDEDQMKKTTKVDDITIK